MKLGICSCLLLAILHSHGACAQSKVYVAFERGVIGFRGPSLVELGMSFSQTSYLSASIEYEKRAIGAINFLTGLSFLSATYELTSVFAEIESKYRGNFVLLPLMARWNVKNKNFCVADVGIMPFYLLDANLNETTLKFGNPYNVHGDITRYSKRLYFAYKFQLSFLINRFSAGLFLMIPFKNQNALDGLEDHWGLNAQQSPYIGSNGFSDFYSVGLRVGVRLL